MTESTKKRALYLFVDHKAPERLLNYHEALVVVRVANREDKPGCLPEPAFPGEFADNGEYRELAIVARVSERGTRSRPTVSMNYGALPHVYDFSPLTYGEAKKLASTLSKLDRAFTKAQTKFGYARSFGQYVAMVTSGLGVQGVFARSKHGGFRLSDDPTYTIDHVVEKAVEACRETAGLDPAIPD